MRRNFGPNPLCYPQPVFIIAAWDADGTPNCMNAAWGGISEAQEVSVCISEGHKTTACILHSKAFTISMATADQVIACDYVGITSCTTASTTPATPRGAMRTASTGTWVAWTTSSSPRATASGPSRSSLSSWN